MKVRTMKYIEDYLFKYYNVNIKAWFRKFGETEKDKAHCNLNCYISNFVREDGSKYPCLCVNEDTWESLSLNYINKILSRVAYKIQSGEHKV